MSVNVDLLRKLGMDDKEARVYLAALEFGPTTIAKIAKKSGVKRSTIYEFIDDMVVRDLMIQTSQGKRTLYTASEPGSLKKLLERQTKILDDMMPELLFLSQKAPSRPKIRFYEGIKGIEATYEDTLMQPSESEMLLYSSYGEVYRSMPKSFINSYISRRVRKRIYINGIVPSDKYVEMHSNIDKEELRETIVLPEKDFTISNDIHIYQNKVAIMSFGDEKIGIIIESQQIADTQRAIFNLLWKSLKELDKIRNKKVIN